MPRDLKRDLEVCEKATEGPWALSGKYVVQDKYDKDDFRQVIFKAEHIPKLINDIAFAVEARTGWPDAINRALAAEAEVGRLREALLRLAPADGFIHDKMRDSEDVNLITNVGALRQVRAVLGETP